MLVKRKYELSVAVFKGDPVDFSKFRHTGLWFVPEDHSTDYYFHVTGLIREFVFERRDDFNPTVTRSFAKNVEVGTTKLALTSDELNTVLESVLVNNSDPEFNCQQWVQFALKMLLNKGYLTEKQYNTGLDGMIDATMEAEDEDSAQP